MLPALSPMAWLRTDAIRAVVAQVRPTTVLEIGAGRGAMGARLARRATYLGVEPDQRSWRAACRAIEPLGGAVLLGDVSVVDPASRFDLVCAFEVLEHVADDVGALAAWTSRLAPGGRLLLSVPAGPERFGPADAAVGHLRRYTRASLSEAVTAAGLSLRSLETYGAGLGNVLEWTRNRVLRPAPGADPTSGSARSGRVLQPSGAVAALATAVVAAPFRVVQRARPLRDRGVGYVMSAARAADAP